MNPWIIHVKAFRAANPTVSYKDCLKQAKATYVSPKTGASRGRIIGKDLDLKKATTKEFGLEMRKGAGIFGSIMDVGLDVALGPLAVVPFLDPRNMVKAGQIMGEHQTTNEGRAEQDRRLLKTLTGIKIGGGIASDVWKKGKAFIKKNPKLLLKAAAEVKKVIDSPNKIKAITHKLNQFITAAIK
jgi:hypothetical protein